jgi:RimJ/RimL family protein N-acetyltransferase
MIEQVFDRDEVRDHLRTDPATFEAIGGEHGEHFSEDAILLKHGDIGYSIFYPEGDGIYDSHANYFSRYWGQDNWSLTMGAAKDAFKWMFDNTDATLLVASVAHAFPQVQRFCSRIGMHYTGRDETSEHFEIRKP